MQIVFYFKWETETEKLNLKEYQATFDSGAVTVTLSGKLKLTSIDTKPEVVDPEDPEMLSGLIIAATNEAIRSANDKKQSVMDKLSEDLNVSGLF